MCISSSRRMIHRPNGATTIRDRCRATFVTASWVALCAAPGARAQHPGGSAVHPPMPGQRFVLVCRWDESAPLPAGTVKFDLALTGPASEPGREFRIPKSDTVLKVVRYLPQAALEQRVVEDEGSNARPGVELSIDGPTQSVRRWLIADDPERNRLISFIGTWRLMSAGDRAARDELFRLFETELTRDPKLIVSRSDGGGAAEISLSVGSAQPLSELETTVRVLRFFPDYAMEASTDQPVNRSEQRRNPAALVELSSRGKTEERWVFAKFPGFEPKDAERLPLRVTLDCPVRGSEKTPDFAVIAIGSSELEVWVRHEGEVRSKSLRLREPVDVAGSQYRFQALAFIPKGKMIEEYQPAVGGRGVPALLVEAADGPHAPTKLWLELGETKIVLRGTSPLSISFQTDANTPPGVHP